jgi:hypothetical protein
MANVIVILKLRGIQATLRSAPVQAEVSRRAARVARVAGDGFAVVTKPHRYTSRAFVQTHGDEGAKRQAEDAVLQRALGAAR